MDNLPPETSDKPRVNEVTPLHQSDELVIDDELYALGGAVGGVPEVEAGICDSTAVVSEEIRNPTTITFVIDDSSEELDGAGGCEDEATSEFSDIVKASFYTWLRFPPRNLRTQFKENKDLEVLTPKAKHDMALIWRHFRAERDSLPESEVIVEQLAEAIVYFFYGNTSRQVNAPEEIKEAFTARITKGVSDGWQEILEGIEKEDKERARRKREKRRKIREHIRKSEEIAEVLRFYAPFRRINNYEPLSCRRLWSFLCSCCSIFIFQIPIHTVLLTWPISIGVMGGLYMTQCPMSHLMPYVMMALGAIGTLALLMRLSFVTYERLTENKITSMWPWIVLKVIEFTFLDFLIIQLFYYFSETPSFVPGSPLYCNKTFYTFVHWANYASIALVSAWIFVYLIKVFVWIQYRKFDLGFRLNIRY